MASRLNPYISFNGTAREAMEFYADVFGGTPNFVTNFEYEGAGAPDAERIVHAVLETDAGYTIMGADVFGEEEYRPMSGCSICLSGDDEDALRGCWERLSAGGATIVPLEKQAWGDEYGMCVDAYGVSWMVDIG